MAVGRLPAAVQSWLATLYRLSGPLHGLLNRPQLPAALFIGAQRSGTTFLQGLLAAHPGVRFGRRLERNDGRWRFHPEPHFFDRFYHRGPRWYQSCFPRAVWERENPWLFCDKTPKYLCDPLVPARVRRLLPSAKFLVLLREPVERAYSHHRRRCRVHGLDLSFDQAMRLELASWQAGTATLFAEDRLTGRPAWLWKNPLTRGLYAYQLERWFAILRASNS